MRSLTLKLTLAFLLAGVTGVAVFALLMGQQTRSMFDRYLSARDQAVLVDSLHGYYATHGSWDGVTRTLASSPILSHYSNSAVLADANLNVIVGDSRYPVGQQIPSSDLNNSTIISVSGQTVGYVLFTPLTNPPENGPGNTSARNGPPFEGPGNSGFGPPAGPQSGSPGLPPEADFLNRVVTASLTSAGITALVALILGAILASTLTRPIGELTAATKAMASGKLDQRVKVRSRDEIGTLATSFNQMSTDLARASQLRKQMTADLAHDLRTPLSILRGYTEGLEEQRLEGTPSVYGIMHAEVLHLQRLVEDLRTLSLADAGELPLNRRAVDPKALLERTGLAYIVQAEERNLTLRVEAADGLPSIAVDTDRMTQVLNNLVSNAMRHTTQGEIVLSARAENQRVCMQVSDTGAGIQPEHLPFIFDRFYRADPSRQRGDGADSDSSGLGLAIAKAIVEAHGGNIVVESTPGHGTTFNLYLPAAS